jgi:hypothetical protein
VIDRVTPARRDLHLIADNYATHKHAKVQRWLKRHTALDVAMGGACFDSDGTAMGTASAFR